MDICLLLVWGPFCEKEDRGGGGGGGGFLSHGTLLRSTTVNGSIKQSKPQKLVLRIPKTRP